MKVQDITLGDYETAKAFVGDRGERRLAHNTWVRTLCEDDDFKCVQVILHATSIVEYDSDGWVRLYTAGYATATTRQRINALLPAGWQLYQSKKQWYLYHKPTDSTYAFADFSYVKADGQVSGLQLVAA